LALAVNLFFAIAANSEPPRESDPLLLPGALGVPLLLLPLQLLLKLLLPRLPLLPLLPPAPKPVELVAVGMPFDLHADPKPPLLPLPLPLLPLLLAAAPPPPPPKSAPRLLPPGSPPPKLLLLLLLSSTPNALQLRLASVANTNLRPEI
jgi:hypothetical protein